ncbi:hypothetical protein HII31_07136 [Pseudocercospora fuligena]|uniref:SnoaL-like domain-containing protein n=1 Tax=Pseudocercospora fuligena TaxID=685502 RepID=A0A8H6RHI5_9PEZI|nr:hypothetical protein HII31_07136 [Pseudocercospora fuligena]
MTQQWHPVGDGHVWDKESVTEQDIAEAKRIADHLENIIKGTIVAINSRDFGIDSLAWQYMCDNYEKPSTTGITGGTHSKRELLEQFRALVTIHPDFQIEMTNISTNVYKKYRRAEVYMESRAGGGPNFASIPGMARSSISLFHFQLHDDGKWRYSREVTLPGLNFE